MGGRKVGFLLISLIVTWILISELAHELAEQEQRNKNGMQLPMEKESNRRSCLVCVRQRDLIDQ